MTTAHFSKKSSLHARKVAQTTTTFDDDGSNGSDLSPTQFSPIDERRVAVKSKPQKLQRCVGVERAAVVAAIDPKAGWENLGKSCTDGRFMPLILPA